jgi:hypothetical protein
LLDISDTVTAKEIRANYAAATKKAEESASNALNGF